MATLTELDDSMKRFLDEPVYATISYLRPDGSPYATQIWADHDGKHVRISITETRKKHDSFRRDGRVAMTFADHTNMFRAANMRGRVVEMTKEGAEEHIDKMAQKYLGKDTYPWRQPGEERIMVKILPERIHTQGVK